MARKNWLFFVFGALLLVISQPAFAKDGLFGVGARFAWENYKQPMLTQVNSTGADIDLGVDLTSLNKTNFGGDLQIKPIDRLTITLAFDMGFSKHTMAVEQIDPMTNQPYDVEAKASFMSFGFLLGAKFYVMPPSPQKASLYLTLSGGKYISSVKNDVSGQNTFIYGKVHAIKDLASPLVIQFAVGAEFFATQYFSIGADVLGFRMAYSKSDQGRTAAEMGYWHGTQKLITLAFYSALTLNFGFTGGGKKKERKPRHGDNEDIMGPGNGGWGSSSGGGGSAGGGWGSSSGGGSAGANDGWASSPAPASGADAPAPASGNDGWSGAPSTPPEDNGGGGWDNQPPPADNGGGAGGGWEAQPPPPAGSDEESPIRPNKPRGGGRGGRGGGGGGGGSAPPPPPPGY